MSTLTSSMPQLCPDAVLETIVAGLVGLFLAAAAGDTAAAQNAARVTLLAYKPQTEAELRLAAQIISFGFQALGALSQAADPQMPLNRVLRLRGSAVSLSRESHKAQRQLDKLQHARRNGLQPAEAQPVTAPPAAEKAAVLVEDTRKVAAEAKAHGITWTQAYKERQRDLRIAAGQQRAEARAAQPNAPRPVAPGTGTATAALFPNMPPVAPATAVAPGMALSRQA